MDEIVEKILDICTDIYDVEGEEIKPDTNFRALQNWDSLTQINLVMALERAFKIRFSLKDITALLSPNEIAALIKGKK